MRIAILLVGLCLGITLPRPVCAQAPADTPATSPDPATLKAARDALAAMQSDRNSVLNAMAAPMVGLMQQIGLREPDKAQVLVKEVVLPTLTAHYDELLEIQARGFATVLGKDDLQAMAAFYATPAGKRLAAAQPQLAQVQLQGMQQWMQAMTPDMQAKLVAAIKAHGWGLGGQTKQHWAVAPMIRSELIARVAAQNPHLYAKDVEVVLTTILDTMADALARGDWVEVRDFGSFTTHEIQARSGRNTRTGAFVAVEARKHIAFKPGKVMRRRLNAEAASAGRMAQQQAS